MRKALLIGLAFFGCCRCEAQTSWGMIKFSNVGISNAAGNGTYNVPIYAPYNLLYPGAGAGTMPGGATVALFRASDLPDAAPLASVRLRTDQFSYFFAEFPTVEVPGVLPGDTATLVIRAWGGPSFEDTHYRSEWSFTTKPLGGIRPSDGVEIATPGLTGWGSEDSSGFTLGPLSIWPWPRITMPINESVLAASEQTTIQCEVVMESNMGECVLTDLTLLANETVLRSQNGPSPKLTATVKSLAPGAYALRFVSSGYFQSGSARASYGPHTSAPVNITIVAPIETHLSTPDTTDNQVTFNYTVNPGLKYVVKTSSDLVNWDSLVTNAPSASPAVFADPAGVGASRFYKVDRLTNP
jgi:hypothetical protein